MAFKSKTIIETSTDSDDAVTISKTRNTAGPADTSGSTDAVSASQTAFRSQGDTSTSTDAVTLLQGRSGQEASASTDAIPTLVKTNNRFIGDVSFSFDNVFATIQRGEISDYQFVLETTPRIPFGQGQAISGKFNPGGFQMNSQDSDGAVGDYRLFGTDRKSPPTWAWDLFTDVYTPEDARVWADNLGRAWDDGVRNTPEGAIAMRYGMAGTIRRVYGRPRNFTPVLDSIQNGKIHIICDFALSEDIYYEDTENTATAGLSPSIVSGSGIILPQVLPWIFSTTPPPRTGQVIIGGTQKTWVDIIFHGPTVNPYVQIGTLTWGLIGSIPLGETVSLSGKPWSMGIKRGNGFHVPGWLDPRARLSALQMLPGSYSVQFGGVDNTGTSSVELHWRNAYRVI